MPVLKILTPSCLKEETSHSARCLCAPVRVGARTADREGQVETDSSYVDIENILANSSKVKGNLSEELPPGASTNERGTLDDQSERRKPSPSTSLKRNLSEERASHSSHLSAQDAMHTLPDMSKNSAVNDTPTHDTTVRGGRPLDADHLNNSAECIPTQTLCDTHEGPLTSSEPRLGVSPNVAAVTPRRSDARPERNANGGKQQTPHTTSGKAGSAAPVCAPWRKCRQRRVYRLILLAACCSLLAFLTGLHRLYLSTFDPSDPRFVEDEAGLTPSKDSGRYGVDHAQTVVFFPSPGAGPTLGSVPVNASVGGNFSLDRRRREIVAENGSGDGAQCMQSSIHHFPPNFVPKKFTEEGGWVVHLVISFYMFAAIAQVCDNYFVPSLEHICEDLALQADVAGATFMAAASSAPELCTSIIGVFLARSDVGLGTIVGSSIFNLLFIVAACALFSGMPVQLSWYPLTRDSLFYIISIVELTIVIFDTIIKWWEALILVLTYSVYVLVMVFNARLDSYFNSLVDRRQAKKRELKATPSGGKIKMMEARRKSRIAIRMEEDTLHHLRSSTRELGRMGLPHNNAFHHLRSMSMDALGPEQATTTTTTASTRDLKEDVTSPVVRPPDFPRVVYMAETVVVQAPDTSGLSPAEAAQASQAQPGVPSEESPRTGTNVDQLGAKVVQVREDVVIIPTAMADAADTPEDKNKIEVSEYENPLSFPDGCCARLYWIFVLPLTMLHAFTIPDSRIPGGWQAKLYMVAFGLSVFYIALYSYVMVWMVAIAGHTVGIPETVTGLTILAAGTSVPDCLSSVFVARDGYGDMAVSNAIGSNVFDILLCLGIPWLIDGLLYIETGHGTQIDSNGMAYASITLLVTCAYLWVSLKAMSWTLTVKYGLLTLVVYIGVTVLCIMLEANIFFDLNKPPCPEP
ncbi:sodium/potassium/calcium exchanger 3 [Aplysia californica]|uniref:Sodium/potassium/calcium exchanger 3 n=1 Tax=Aplysia californica TaxID=6500 RepID=A0ABM0ZUL9_APLCA|nr:sodium/potassium/calcium exchanger 3 [Aplysia californica]